MQGDGGKGFWNRVVEALGDKGIKKAPQARVAEYAKVKQSSVSAWQNQGALPTMDHAMLLAKRLGVSVAWLLEGIGEKRPAPEDPDSRSMWSIWSGMDQVARTTILIHAKFVAAQLASSTHPTEQGAKVSSSSSR